MANIFNQNPQFFDAFPNPFHEAQGSGFAGRRGFPAGNFGAGGVVPGGFAGRRGFPAGNFGIGGVVPGGGSQLGQSGLFERFSDQAQEIRGFSRSQARRSEQGQELRDLNRPARFAKTSEQAQELRELNQGGSIIPPQSSGVNTFPTEVLEGEQDAFQGALSRSSRDLTPNQLEFFRGERERFFRQFVGQRNTTDEQKARGEVSQDQERLTFRKFLQSVDFNSEFQNLAPNVRRGAGDQPGLFNQRARFLN